MTCGASWRDDLFTPVILLAAGLALALFVRMFSWRKQPQAKPVVIVSVMLEGAGRLLLGKRVGASAKNTGEVLSTPGGKVDFHETLKAAAARELLEEAGLQVYSEDFVVLGFKEHPNRYGGHFITFYVTAQLSQAKGVLENREPSKCAGWQWLALDEFEHSQCTEPEDVLAYWRTYWRANAKTA